jgi:uncharacterized protein (TIGR03067 family)
MRKWLWILPVFYLLTLQTLAADDRTDKDKLQGTWVVTSVAFMGKTKTFEKVEEASYTFKDDKITIHDPSNKKDKGVSVSFKLDDRKDPKQFDMTGPSDDDPKETVTVKGFYRLDGDTLTLCVGPPRGERPARFDDNKGVVMTLKRK